jgi:hypothetical protein
MKRREMNRRGLTLIDVVTLAAIVLTASTFVVGFAYQAEEEVKRQGICRERLRMNSLGIFQYGQQSSRSEIPGYINLLKRDDELAYHDPRTFRAEPVSWVILLLPYMDRQSLYREWKTATPAAADGRIGGPPLERTHVFLDYLVCPNEAPETPTGTPLSFAVNTGIPDFPTSDHSWSAPPLPKPRMAGGGGPDGGSFIARDQMTNGVFLDAFSLHPLFTGTISKEYRLSSLDFIRDRKDQTILLAENVDTSNYTFDPPKADDPTAEEIYPTTERRLGIIWAPSSQLDAGSPLPVMTPPKPSYRINVEAGKGNGSNYDHSRPSSKHPGGVNMAMASGSVQYFNTSRTRCRISSMPS